MSQISKFQLTAYTTTYSIFMTITGKRAFFSYEIAILIPQPSDNFSSTKLKFRLKTNVLNTYISILESYVEAHNKAQDSFL